jgi:SAM-dependent methyltransferase
MTNPPPSGEDVIAYYGTGLEADRLAAGVGALELARTQELILRFLPAAAEVADVGGAVGRYAGWLAARGHRVELVEPVPLHVELARERAGEPPRFDVHLADARSLPFADQSFDAVLLLGPLYHLGEREDRDQALREAVRVCRQGGLIFAAAISRYASLFDAIRRGRIGEAELMENVRRETETGRRVPLERRTSPFPDAYFHLPAELEDELAAAGVEVNGVYGVEGPAGWLSELHWEDEALRERALALARAAEADPHLVAVSAHLLGVGRKVA